MNDLIAMTSNARGSNRTTGTDRRMLVVDDDLDLSRIVGRVVHLVDASLVVDIAPTGKMARKMLAQHQYQFVMVDYFLDNDEKGVDLLQLIRDQQPDAGIAMMSSLDLQRFLDAIAGERDLQILPKPFSNGQLKAFLFEVLPAVEADTGPFPPAN